MFAEIVARLVRIEAKIDKLGQVQQTILQGEIKMAFDITALTSAVTNETTVDQSVLAFINNITGQLNTLLANSGNTVNPADIQQIVATIQNNSAVLQAAVSANTPAAPSSAALTANPQVATLSNNPNAPGAMPKVNPNTGTAAFPMNPNTGTAASPTLTISGSVGQVGQGATLTLTGPSSATTEADAFGNYSFIGLGNGSYTVTPTMNGFTFSPVSVSVAVAGLNATAPNIVATKG